MSLFVDIEKKLDNYLLKVCFEANNEVLSLLGASGCGKSMTLKCIAGIEKPDKGKIILNGTTLFDSEKKINLPPQERRVGYLFQQYALFPNMTVEHNIMCGVRGKSKKEKKEIANAMINKMRLTGKADKLPGRISGGEQQRVALARILVNEPEVLLLDEPFSALDSFLKTQLEQEVRVLIKSFNKPVLLVSHDRNEVYRISSRTAIMNKGLIETIGNVEDVFDSPETVNGAILTGYKNISSIVPIDENTVYAENWDIKIKVKLPSENVKHIGIRTKNILLSSDSSENNNNFECNIVDVLDNPYSVMLLLQPVASKAEGYLYFNMLKTDYNKIQTNQLIISLPKSSIIFFK